MQSLASSICNYNHGIPLSILTAEYLLKTPITWRGHFFGHPVEPHSFSYEKREGLKIEGTQISIDLYVNKNYLFHCVYISHATFH